MKRYANRRRKSKAKKRYFDRLIHAGRLHSEQGGKCHWCAVPVVILRLIPQSERSELVKGIIHLANGESHWIASVDHVNGLDDRSVMVIACECCNGNRARLSHRGWNEFIKRRRRWVQSQYAEYVT